MNNAISESANSNKTVTHCDMRNGTYKARGIKIRIKLFFELDRIKDYIYVSLLCETVKRSQRSRLKKKKIHRMSMEKHYFLKLLF